MRRTCVAILMACFALANVAWSASVTVAKPPTVANHTTVQAGIIAASAGGTVTILDSEVYVEDVTIGPAENGITVQAAVGQRPTIRAANNSPNRWSFLAPFGLTAPDRLGLVVIANCTLTGLRIQKTDPLPNTLGVGLAMSIQGSSFFPVTRVTVRNCQIVGPGNSNYDIAGVAILSWDPTNTAEVVFEDCETTNTDYGIVPVNFTSYLSAYGWPFVAPDPVTTITRCLFQGNYEQALDNLCGTTTLVNCTFRNNPGSAVAVEGGFVRMTGCDIMDSGDEAILLSFDDGYNFNKTNYPVAVVTDCLIARSRGSGRAASVRVDNGRLTMDHSIVCFPQSTAAIYMDDNDAQYQCILNMDFCDIYAPGQDIYWSDQDVRQHPIQLTATNSIMFGRNGILNPANGTTNVFTITSSTLAVTDVATSGPGITSTNVVNIVPYYLLPYSAARPGYRYTNANLNIGPGATDIGSQGRFIPLQPLSVRRSWILYR